jgi:hypothetical protein
LKCTIPKAQRRKSWLWWESSNFKKSQAERAQITRH